MPALLERLEQRIQFAFSVTDLGVGDTPVLHVNNNGQVLTVTGDLYAGGTVTNIAPAGQSITHAKGFSNAGEAVGFGSMGQFYYDGATFIPIADKIGNELGQVGAMNGDGDIAGIFFNPSGPENTHLYRWTAAGGFEDLGGVPDETNVLAMSEDGTKITGSTKVSGVVQAFLYDGTFKPLGIVNTGTAGGFSLGDSVNDAGHIVGRSTADANNTQKPFFFDGSTMTNLDPTPIGAGLASSINNAGTIVGYAGGIPGAFVRQGGVNKAMQDEVGSAWSISLGTTPPKINTAGQIAITGFSNTSFDVHVLLLTPSGGGGNGGGGNGTGGPETDSVAPSITSVGLPAVSVPGDDGRIRYSIVSAATSRAKASTLFELFASTDTTISTDDIALGSKSKRISLAAGKTTRSSFTAELPDSIPAGTYNLLGRLTATGGDNPDAINDTIVMPQGTIDVVYSFGFVGTRSNVALKRTAADGTVVTFKLSRAGTATWSDDGGVWDLSLTGTTDRSKLSITTKGGSRVAPIDDILTDSTLGTISASRANLSGNVTITGDSKSLTFGAVTGPNNISIGGATPTTLKFALLFSTTIVTTANVKSFTVSDPMSQDSHVTAPAFPRRVRIDGVRLDPLTDPRFELTPI